MSMLSVHLPHRDPATRRPGSLRRWLTSAPAPLPRVSPAQLMPLAILAGGFAADEDDLDVDLVAATATRHLSAVPELPHAWTPRPATAARPLHAAG